MSMGPGFGGSGSINRLKANVKDAKLLLKMAGEDDYSVIDNFAGRIKSTDYYKNSGAPNRNPPIPAYWAYKFIFEVSGAQDDQYNGEYILELGEDNRFVPVVLNSLAGASYDFENPIVQFRVYEKDGYPSIHFYRNDDVKDKMSWKYSFSDDVPDRIDTGEFNENGDPKYDYTPQEEFWKKVYREEVYPAINKKPFEGQRDLQKLAKMKKRSEEKMFPNLTKENFAEAWNKLCTWMGEHMQNSADQEELRIFWQSKLSSLGSKDKLHLNGTMMGPATETQAEPSSDDDQDLPF